MSHTSNQPLPAVGQLPADPQPDTVALLDAVTTPGRSIPHRVWLAHGGLILDPADLEDAPAITPHRSPSTSKRLACSARARRTPDPRSAWFGSPTAAGWSGVAAWRGR
jgi:hypothetical protein